MGQAIPSQYKQGNSNWWHGGEIINAEDLNRIQQALDKIVQGMPDFVLVDNQNNISSALEKPYNKMYITNSRQISVVQGEEFNSLVEEVNNLKNILNAEKVLKTAALTYDQGGLSITYASTTTNAARIRTHSVLSREIVGVKVPDGFRIWVFAFNGTTYVGRWTNMGYSKSSATGITTTSFTDNVFFSMLSPEDYTYKIVVSKIDDSNIVPSDASGLKYFYNTDNTLSVSGKAADAKTTGDRIAAIEAIDTENRLDSLESEVAAFAPNTIAPAYLSSAAYSIGDYCTNEGSVYRCIAATSGTFEPSDWEIVLVSGEFNRMDEDVNDLKSAFIQQDYEPLFELTVDDAAPTGWKLNGTGGSVSASGYTIHKKRINAKSILKIIASADTVFQFQDNTATVPTGDNSHLIGTPVVGVFNDYVTAPTGAGYLMISYPDSDTSVSVTLIKQAKTILGASFDGALKALDASELNISKGGYNNKGVQNYNNSSIHTSALPLNTVLVEMRNNLLSFYFAIWNSNGTHVGFVDAEGFHASGTANTQYFQSFANVTGIMKTYGSGTVRLVIVARNGANIQSLNYNEYFTVYTNTVGTSLSIESAKKDMFNSAYSSVDLTTKLKEYATIVASGSASADSFLFFTDPHYFESSDELADGWQNHMLKYMPTIQKAYNSTPTNFCLCGGDWLTNGDTPEEAATKLGYMTGVMNDFFHPYYMINGNHDTNYQGTEELSTAALINLMFGNYGKMYYSFTTPNTRFYVFDTGKDSETSMTTYRWEQVDWFGKQLLANTSDEHIVIALHIVTNQTETNFDSNPTFQSMATNIAKIADAYNNKTSITLNEETYNFSSATGTVEFIIAGHTHWDKITELENIPVLITQEAFAGSTSTFDLVFADYANRVVKTVRIGDGSNRTMNLAT